MKKAGLMVLFAALLISMPFAAADVQLGETMIHNIIIKELNNPAKFEITITNNNDYDDIFHIDTLQDINITPQDDVLVPKNSAKTVEKEIYPSADMRKTLDGLFTFEYYADGDKSNVKKSAMTLDFVTLSGLITVTVPPTITKDTSKITAIINLTKDATLDADLTIVSELMSFTEKVTLTNEGLVLEIPLKDTLPNAGTYEVKSTFEIDGYSHVETGNIVLESEISLNELEPLKSGYFLNSQTVYEKENTGNSVTDATITIKKSVISGLFTTFSIKPSSVKTEGSTATYEFTKELNPGESLSVTATTSYYLPIIIIVLLILAGWIFVVVTTPQVKVMKKAVRVRTKSGAFATKIVLSVKNTGKTDVENVKIIDRLPPFTELVPGKFGTISPTEIRKSTLIWNLDRLGPQEDIMFSYIVYSKLTVIGTLNIPLTYVTYINAKGALHESKSNGLSVIAPEQPIVHSEIIK